MASRITVTEAGAIQKVELKIPSRQNLVKAKEDEDENGTAKKEEEKRSIGSKLRVRKSIKPSSGIFKGLVFRIDVYAKGVDQSESFSEVIRGNGGKVQKILTKAATHLVWTNGSARVLRRTK